MGLEYLSEILDSEESHLPNISSKITELITHTNTLKSDVRTVVEHGSIRFNPLLKENDRLRSTAEDLLKEMTAVQEEIDGEIKNELSDCADELKSLSLSLKEVNLFLETLKKLLEINTLVTSAKKKMERQEFHECTQLVTTAQKLIKENSDSLKQVEIFKILSQEVVLTYEQLMYQISEIWSQFVNINQKDDSVNNTTQSTVTVDVNSHEKIFEILKASNILKSSSVEKKFSNALLKNILNKVIMNKSKVSVSVDDKALLLIEINNNEKNPNYLAVFESIQNIIEFLKSYLDFEIEDGVKFLSKVGSFIGDEFADDLIKNCLSETIPTNSNDLDKYKDVVENAEIFERTLQEAGFLRSNSSSLLDYAKNINVLFANKFCQSYLQKARTIMMKDLHNVTSTEDVVSDVTILPSTHRSILKEKFNIQNDVFSFPKCQISKQAEEVMSLVKSMMKEIEKSLDLCAVRLFYTVRNIFEMYSAVVPLHHKKFLETLPHHVALFHNNCLYFTHNLINIATEYYNKIPSVLKDHFTILLEEAVVLRSLAAETLEVTVTKQRNHLIYILRDSGFATLNENPKLDPNSEKSIRQCIRQLQILQKVWSEVLPVNVYNRAIGFLLDAVIEELISLIISVEDISAHTASELVSCFSMIVEKTPVLLSDPREIYRHSRKWQRFNEFIHILKGSLRDIEDRWAAGLGPLAVEFTPEQIKHMIRALFQNSDRRAALLSRIR